MVLTYIMIAGLFFFLFAAVNNGLATARKFTGQLLVNGLAAIACIAASFFLIPRYGITGAALSLTICYATGFLGCLFFMVIALIGETRSTKSPPLLKPLLTSQDEP